LTLFLTTVMVMDKDAEVKANRWRFLPGITGLFFGNRGFFSLVLGTRNHYRTHESPALGLRVDARVRTPDIQNEEIIL